MDIIDILWQMGISNPKEIIQFKDMEDESNYEVWKINVDNEWYVLKKAKKYELSIYQNFFKDIYQGIPKFYNWTTYKNENYILIEYIEGNDLSKCNRESLTIALNTIISLQKLYWENKELQNIGLSFDESLKNRKERGKYLNDKELENVYEEFIKRYISLPRTLCHDDLLPFNILVNKEKATVIDWEVGGILPYPTSLVRLIAHGTNNKESQFYMTDEDKEFAINYYYENLIKEKNIDYDEYLKTIQYFIFYEYCEWIMLGNKYEDADIERYNEYLKKAKELLQRNLK